MSNRKRSDPSSINTIQWEIFVTTVIQLGAELEAWVEVVGIETVPERVNVAVAGVIVMKIQKRINRKCRVNLKTNTANLNINEWSAELLGLFFFFLSWRFRSCLGQCVCVCFVFLRIWYLMSTSARQRRSSSTFAKNILIVFQDHPLFSLSSFFVNVLSLFDMYVCWTIRSCTQRFQLH